MIAEWGHFCLILALVFALTGLCSFKKPTVLVFAYYGMASSVFMAFIALLYVFGKHDFSVSIVFEQTQSQLPLYYRLSALWGGMKAQCYYGKHYWFCGVSLSVCSLCPQHLNKKQCA